MNKIHQETKSYFVSAIGTDSGKTIFSSILAYALKADYWKPIQAGFPTDTDTVRNLVHFEGFYAHPEGCILQEPMSPHAAAALEDKIIRIKDLQYPKTNKPLVIEGAGGLMVPINNYEMMIEIPDHYNLPVILVCNLYLGSINHSLLSIEILKARNVKLAGIVFNGKPVPSSEEVIVNYAQCPVLLHIPEIEKVTADTLKKLAHSLREKLLVLPDFTMNF